MNIDEAIKVLQKWADAGDKLELPQSAPAFKLGIEALKLLHKYRLDGKEMRFTPLPGETEE